MKLFFRQIKQIILIALLVHCALPAMPQRRISKPAFRKHYYKKPSSSDQLKDFTSATTDAGIYFKFPPGYREIPVLNNEDYSFDYAMEIPGREFEIWLQVSSQKEDYILYEQTRNDRAKRIETPDSAYIRIGQAQASALCGDQQYFMRNISSDVLVRYNANEGKSYLFSLPDLPETKHYKYALVLTLQRDHVGTILAVCFTNEKNPEFFKNINRISQYLKFKI